MMLVGMYMSRLMCGGLCHKDSGYYTHMVRFGSKQLYPLSRHFLKGYEFFLFVYLRLRWQLAYIIVGLCMTFSYLLSFN